MKFSVFTVETQTLSMEDTLDLLKNCGYDGVEWRVRPSENKEECQDCGIDDWYKKPNNGILDLDIIEEKALEVKKLCNDKGLEISQLATYLLPKEKESIEKVIRAANLMGCKQIRINVPLYKGDINYNTLFEETANDIEALLPYSRKYGVRINVEIHHNKIIPSCSAVYRLVSRFDPKDVGVIHDAGNMMREGYENYQLGLELLGPYLAHVHLKNSTWLVKETLEDGTIIWDSKWDTLKNGHVNFRTLMKALNSVGYNEYLSFEDFSTEKETREKVQENITYIKGIINELAI